MFQDDNNLYLVLEYVSGGELFSHLRRKEKFDEETARFISVEVACALYDLHELHICHRDIRPENIL